MKQAVIFVALLGLAGAAIAEETPAERTEATLKDTKRGLKKGAHRVEEKICMKGDAECLAEKAKHRAEEAASATKDKAEEAADKVD